MRDEHKADGVYAKLKLLSSLKAELWVIRRGIVPDDQGI